MEENVNTLVAYRYGQIYFPMWLDSIVFKSCFNVLNNLCIIVILLSESMSLSANFREQMKYSINFHWRTDHMAPNLLRK